MATLSAAQEWYILSKRAKKDRIFGTDVLLLRLLFLVFWKCDTAVLLFHFFPMRDTSARCVVMGYFSIFLLFSSSIVMRNGDRRRRKGCIMVLRRWKMGNRSMCSDFYSENLFRPNLIRWCDLLWKVWALNLQCIVTINTPGLPAVSAYILVAKQSAWKIHLYIFFSERFSKKKRSSNPDQKWKNRSCGVIHFFFAATKATINYLRI